MKRLKINLTTLLAALLTLIGTQAFAQQEPMYSQYMFNGVSINPAYVGSHEAVSLSALARRQWTGLEGSPTTETFTIHSPLGKGTGLAGGLNIIHDQIGATNRVSVATAFAYQVPLGFGKLSFGVKTGLINYRTDYSKLTVQNPNDFVYGEAQVVSEVTPDVGAGVYYYSDKFFAGLSIPSILNTGSTSSEGVSIENIKKHYFLYSGYVFTLSETLKLKPNVLVKAVEGAPVQLDLNANMYYKDIFGVGLSYRSLDALALIMQYNISPKLSFGYSYDFATTTELNQVQYGSHEFVLNYRFSFDKNILLTPRYF